MTIIPEQLEKEIRAVFAEVDIEIVPDDDQDEFDLAFEELKELGALAFDAAQNRSHFPCGPTIYTRMLADMSTAARHAVSTHGWTIDVKDWANA